MSKNVTLLCQDALWVRLGSPDTEGLPGSCSGSGISWHVPVLSDFTEMQLIKMQFVNDTESEEPNASAALEKKMRLCK